jgi:hypothetical protein
LQSENPFLFTLGHLFAHVDVFMQSLFVIFGLSRVRALPLAAGINVLAIVLGIILVRAECMRCPWLLV